ncbi:MAG TPA: hypothetical protein VIF62_34010, partial [Labilithrix sp.]
MKALVVYYSRNEAMRATAHAVAAKLDADVDAVLDCLEPDGFLGWRRCPVGAGRRLVRIDLAARELGLYEIVVVGTPVRDTSIATPITDFLAEEGRTARALAFFCMTPNVRGARALGAMARAARRAPIASLAVTQTDVEHGLLPDHARDFATNLRDALAQVARASATRAPLPGADWPAIAARR